MASFTWQSLMFEIHPSFFVYPYVVLLYGQVVGHCMGVPQFFIHSPVEGLEGFSQFLVIVNKAAVNIGIQVFV